MHIATNLKNKEYEKHHSHYHIAQGRYRISYSRNSKQPVMNQPSPLSRPILKKVFLINDTKVHRKGPADTLRSL
jgi:hypothetical protein